MQPPPRPLPHSAPRFGKESGKKGRTKGLGSFWWCGFVIINFMFACDGHLELFVRWSQLQLLGSFIFVLLTHIPFLTYLTLSAISDENFAFWGDGGEEIGHLEQSWQSPVYTDSSLSPEDRFFRFYPLKKWEEFTTKCCFPYAWVYFSTFKNSSPKLHHFWLCFDQC